MGGAKSFHLHSLIAAIFIVTVRADWWDDFSNNLATDLAPLITLFGEQATKQFLSESTTIWDNMLFALCPLGILTGVVSAIRVCGSPSLRAFIGRAQEGGAPAEAELCSSTSRDVCELYHNGAIIRTLGRPKILEVIFVQDHSSGEHENIFLAQDFFQNNEEGTWTEERSSKSLKEKGDLENQKPSTGDEATSNRLKLVPNPNLSLNIGMENIQLPFTGVQLPLAF
ncbi:hypothetical protein TruAng_010488 [Truncatella angustata]|nr:hypothetical protein TruAng_010488 [Truncatella angustata]